MRTFQSMDYLQDQMAEVARLIVKELNKRLAQKNITLEVRTGSLSRARTPCAPSPRCARHVINWQALAHHFVAFSLQGFLICSVPIQAPF